MKLASLAFYLIRLQLSYGRYTDARSLLAVTTLEIPTIDTYGAWDGLVAAPQLLYGSVQQKHTSQQPGLRRTELFNRRRHGCVEATCLDDLRCEAYFRTVNQAPMQAERLVNQLVRPGSKAVSHWDDTRDARSHIEHLDAGGPDR